MRLNHDDSCVNACSDNHNRVGKALHNADDHISAHGDNSAPVDNRVSVGTALHNYDYSNSAPVDNHRCARKPVHDYNGYDGYSTAIGDHDSTGKALHNDDGHILDYAHSENRPSAGHALHDYASQNNAPIDNRDSAEEALHNDDDHSSAYSDEIHSAGKALRR